MKRVAIISLGLLVGCSEGQLGRDPMQFFGKVAEGSLISPRKEPLNEDAFIPQTISRHLDDGRIILYRRVPDPPAASMPNREWP